MKRLLFIVAFTLAAYVIVLLCVVGCANMGAGPDGGPYDETPPRIVGMTTPSQVASGNAAIGGRKKKHKSTKFQLMFSELIQIENPSENVIVSPPQKEMPNIQAVGRKITVELLDSLLPNTTYTVDFADAIKDNNEGNPLGHFTYIFSTGEVVDTMEMSGYVLNAEDLEPQAGVLVGLHRIPADSVEWSWETDTAFTTRPFDRVARTDASGYFSIKGVADGGKYHIYGLKDGDGDFTFSQKGEAIAFSRTILTPDAYADTRYDTLWIDSTRYDSIRVIPFTHYTPDDVTLLTFQERGQPRTLLKAERTQAENFKTWFTAPSKHVPAIRGLNFDARGAFVEERSAGNDTIVYWMSDSLLLQQDTLTFAYDFMAWNDSLQQHILQTDTLELVTRTSWKKRMENEQKEEEKWQKALERRHKRGDYSQEVRPLEFLKMTVSGSATLAPNENIDFTFDQPIDHIDMRGVHLSLLVDSIEKPAQYLLDTLPSKILVRRLRAEWRPEQKYRLTIDSAAIRSIYGRHNNRTTRDFSISTLEEFGTYFVTMTNVPSFTTSTDEANTAQGMAMLEALEAMERADADTLGLDTAAIDTLRTDALCGDSLLTDSLLTDSLLADPLLKDSLLAGSLLADSLLTGSLSTDSLATDSQEVIAGLLTGVLTGLVTEEPDVIVQLLGKGGEVVYSVPAVRISPTSVRGEFYYLREGEYYLRCFIDHNGNGIWDPGEWATRQDAEDVYYYNEKVEVRKGWDINGDWDLNALPRFKQKPSVLIKQKKTNDRKASAHERNIKRLEDRKNGGNQNNKSSSSGFGGSGFRF